MNQPKEYKRFGPPSNLDNHEYGTRIIIYKDKAETIYDLYIQLGAVDVNWEYMGEFRKDEKPTVEVISVDGDI